MGDSKIFVLRDDSSLDHVKRGLYNELSNLILENPKQVSITNYKENKTDEQRNGFHMLCKMLGDELGYTLYEIKEMCKAECLPTTVVNIAGREREVTQSSEKIKRIQYSELIETVYRLSAEAGVVLPALFRN